MCSVPNTSTPSAPSGSEVGRKNDGKTTVCACVTLLDSIPVIPVEQFLGGHTNIESRIVIFIFDYVNKLFSDSWIYLFSVSARNRFEKFWNFEKSKHCGDWSVLMKKSESPYSCRCCTSTTKCMPFLLWFIIAWSLVDWARYKSQSVTLRLIIRRYVTDWNWEWLNQGELDWTFQRIYLLVQVTSSTSLLIYSWFFDLLTICTRTFSFIYKQTDRYWFCSLADVSAVIAPNNSLYYDSFLFSKGIELPRDNAFYVPETHIMEFIQSSWFLKSPEDCYCWGGGGVLLVHSAYIMSQY